MTSVLSYADYLELFVIDQASFYYTNRFNHFWIRFMLSVRPYISCAQSTDCKYLAILTIPKDKRSAHIKTYPTIHVLSFTVDV